MSKVPNRAKGQRKTGQLSSPRTFWQPLKDRGPRESAIPAALLTSGAGDGTRTHDILLGKQRPLFVPSTGPARSVPKPQNVLTSRANSKTLFCPSPQRISDRREYAPV